MNNLMPLLPPGMLLRIIGSKSDLISYYSRLIGMAASEDCAAIINGVIEEEQNQRELFMNLFRNLFGALPDFGDSAEPQIPSFVDGIRAAFMMELNNYSVYGNIFFNEQNLEVRNVFLKALFEENSHSAKMNYLLTVNL